MSDNTNFTIVAALACMLFVSTCGINAYRDIHMQRKADA